MDGPVHRVRAVVGDDGESSDAFFVDIPRSALATATHQSGGVVRVLRDGDGDGDGGSGSVASLFGGSVVHRCDSYVVLSYHGMLARLPPHMATAETIHVHTLA